MIFVSSIRGYSYTVQSLNWVRMLMLSSRFFTGFSFGHFVGHALDTIGDN